MDLDYKLCVFIATFKKCVSKTKVVNFIGGGN